MIKSKWFVYSLIASFIFLGTIYYFVLYSQLPGLYKNEVSVIYNNAINNPKTKQKPEETQSETQQELPKLLNKIYINNVPFLSQAPLADWQDERQQDGCEEASAVMVKAWLNNENKLSKPEGLSRILSASDWFKVNVGTFHDASVEDVSRFLKEGLNIKQVAIVENPSLDDYKLFLGQNKLILVPTNGQLLGNPNFSGDGPERHMIVIRGYNDDTGEFIVNDPGTRKGENYRYKYDVVLQANLAYPTGFHEKIDKIRRAIIVVGPEL